MIKDKLNYIYTQIANRSLFFHPVTVVGVTKYATDDQVSDMIGAGIRCFGENTVQGLSQRVEKFTSQQYQWHLIGHLQRNKVKKAVAIVDMIQSVDSLRLLAKIDSECAALSRKIPVLIQVNVSGDPNKYGFSLNEFNEVISELFLFSNVQIVGIMTLGFQDDSDGGIRNVFRKTTTIRNHIQLQYPQFMHVSMGMSKDFVVALEEGASIIRVGSFLYQK